MSAPRTRGGLDAFECISAMQKAIRRGLECDAMEFAVELMHTSKAFHTMVCNRLEVISHEDIETQHAPWIVPFVAAAVAQSKARYDVDSPGEVRLMIGNIIRLLCGAPKSRKGCHFAAAIGLRSEIEGYVPEIPDWALDQHTAEGRRLARGLEHFREEGAKLVPPGTPDEYENEAYRLWALKAKRRPKDDGQDGDAESRLL
jgi:replication-associated recombination protein RarA